MHGEPAWGPDFTHPTYANPQAPKGGHLTHGVLGTFDCLNPFIVKGLPAANMRGYIVESLLARGYDEPFTLYGLLADRITTDDARTYVSFRINPAARFADGKPVTPADVIFSWELLRDKGRPNFRTYYIKANKAEATDARTVRFDLSGADDRELPLIIGLMPVLAKHAVNADTFEDTSFDPLLGSGPYTVSKVKPGESVTFTRDKNYWGRDLAINRGLWNFDTIRYDYYRDGNTHFEAFKKGLYDLRVETDPGRWQTAYDFPAMRDGRVVKEDLSYGLPKGMQGLVFNTRRAVFSDVRVREAILQLFDFERSALSEERGIGACAAGLCQLAVPFLAPVSRDGIIEPESVGSERGVGALRGPLLQRRDLAKQIEKLTTFGIRSLAGEQVGGLLGGLVVAVRAEQTLQRRLQVGHLQRFNPAFQPDWVKKTWVYRTHYAQPVPLVNHSQHIPAIQTPLPGLYFASMSQVYPWDRGTNFAVEIGRKAAKMML